MKYFILLVFLLPVYCSIPIKKFFIGTIEVNSQNGDKVTQGLKAVFFDKGGERISEISLNSPESFNNTLVWQINSQYPEKSQNIKPSDAIRAVTAKISANNCDDKEIPINIISEYQPLSFSPHGGGAAYMYHHFAIKTKMNCY